jgi:hypothetical protein
MSIEERRRLIERFFVPENLIGGLYQSSVSHLSIEVPRPGGDPAAAVWTEPAAGNDAMQVRMKQQVLPPGVQDGGDPKLRSNS